MKTFKQFKEMVMVGGGGIAGTGSGPDPKSAEPPGPKSYMGLYKRKKKTNAKSK